MKRVDANVQLLHQIVQLAEQGKGFAPDSDYTLLREIFKANSVTLLENILEAAFACGRRSAILDLHRFGGNIASDVAAKIEGIAQLVEMVEKAQGEA